MHLSILPEGCFKMISTHIAFKTSSPPLQSTSYAVCNALRNDLKEFSRITELRRKGKDAGIYHRHLQLVALTFFIISPSSSCISHKTCTCSQSHNMPDYHRR